MKWADKIDMKTSSPVTAKRLKKLLDCRQPVLVAGRPVRHLTRPVVFEEVDSFSPAEHQRPAITTRG